MIVELELQDLYVPQGLLPRVLTGTIPEKVEEYTQMIKNGVEFDPILVWKNPQDGKYWIIDGNHRYKAHEKAGKTTIKAKLKDIKNEREFRKEAIKANLKHGIQLEPKEKVINARLLYQDGEEIEEIALIFGVHINTVRNWLKDIIDEEKYEKEQLKQKAWELYQQGYSFREIGEKLGVNHQTAKNYIDECLKTTNLENLDTQPGHYPQNEPQTSEEEPEENTGHLWNQTGWGQLKEEEEQTEENQEEYLKIPEVAKNTIYVSYLKGTSLEEIQEQIKEYFKIELTQEQIQQIIEEEQSSHEKEPDPTTEEIKQIISELRKKGYNKWQIIKYLVDGEDIEGYTFDQIAKAFDTDTISIEELYNEALEMGIKTPRPYQKGKTGRKPKDTSTAYDHEAQFEKLISDAIDYLAKDIYDISLRWGREKAEIYIARVEDWLKNDGEKCIDRNAK